MYKLSFANYIIITIILQVKNNALQTKNNMLLCNLFVHFLDLLRKILGGVIFMLVHLENVSKTFKVA